MPPTFPDYQLPQLSKTELARYLDRGGEWTAEVKAEILRRFDPEFKITRKG